MTTIVVGIGFAIIAGVIALIIRDRVRRPRRNPAGRTGGSSPHDEDVGAPDRTVDPV